MIKTLFAKNITILIIAFIFCGCKSDKLKDFRESEFERGARFTFEWYFKFDEIPSMGVREDAYLNPKASIDSIYYRYRVDSVLFKEYLKNDPERFNRLYSKWMDSMPYYLKAKP